MNELLLCRNFSDASQYVILYFLKVKNLLKKFVIKLLLLMRLLWFLQPRTLASFSTGDLFIIETEYQDVRCTLFCIIHFKSKGEKKIKFDLIFRLLPHFYYWTWKCMFKDKVYLMFSSHLFFLFHILMLNSIMNITF